MRTRIVKIGNSQGVRIPKPLLEQSEIGEEVDIEVQERCLILRPVARPRSGWEQAFTAMAAAGEDRLLDEMTPTEWDQTQWEW